jgi:SAM-dependent methyltransferase
MHGQGEPSDWLLRWAHVMPAGARVLDLACGRGRHTHWLAARGHGVTAVDRDVTAVETLRCLAEVEVIVADLENGAWPLAGRVFDLVLVTNYLWRPLWPAIGGAVAPGGWLVYETFAAGHEQFGRPSRPDFLLQPGELLGVSHDLGLRVVAYETGMLAEPPRVVQRLLATRLAGLKAGQPLLRGAGAAGG